MGAVFKVDADFFHSVVGMEVKVHSIVLANAASDIIRYENGASLFSVSTDAIAISKEHKKPLIDLPSTIYDVIPNRCILYATVEWNDPKPKNP